MILLCDALRQDLFMPRCVVLGVSNIPYNKQVVRFSFVLKLLFDL